MISFYRFFFGIFSILCAINTSTAQIREDNFYVYDANWNGTDIKHAHYLVRTKKINDTSWQWDTYAIYGPLIKTEYSRDAQGNVAEGELYFYNSKGNIDSITSYKKGLADGDWIYKNDTGRTKLTKTYKNGKLIKEVDNIKEDSIKNLEETNEEEEEENEDEEIESEFPGGSKGWARYLNKNLKYPERAINSSIEGVVRVGFIVDENGKIIEPRIFRSVEFSLDEEALRMIKESPGWTPAIQKGKKVKSYKMQPIVFKLE